MSSQVGIQDVLVNDAPWDGKELLRNAHAECIQAVIDPDEPFLQRSIDLGGLEVDPRKTASRVKRTVSSRSGRALRIRMFIGSSAVLCATKTSFSKGAPARVGENRVPP